jgi:hypothetical protein
MKKHAYLTLALLPVLVATGCLREKMDDCTPSTLSRTVSLAFSYREDGAERFLDKINSVDVVVLDSTGGYIRTERVERSELVASGGVARLNLAPGRYRLTCWGNRAANTKLDGLVVADTAGAMIYNTVTAGQVGDCDLLYRAPRAKATRALTGSEPSVEGLLTLDVPASSDVTLPVEFEASHRVVEVRVVNYDQGRTNPMVEIAGLPAGDEVFTGLPLLDPLNRLDLSRVATRKNATAVAGETGVTTVTFVTFPFDLDDTGIFIRVLDPVTQNQAHRVQLSTVADPSTPVVTITLRIIIEFITIDNVTVTIEGWDPNQVNPA